MRKQKALMEKLESPAAKAKQARIENGAKLIMALLDRAVK